MSHGCTSSTKCGAYCIWCTPCKCPIVDQSFTVSGSGALQIPTLPDRLESMWSQQERFMHLLREKRGFPDFPTDITTKKGQQFLKDIRNHMMEELFEAGQHLKNSKSHRATEITDIDREAFVEELCDALHLYIELCIAAGISLDELFDAYMKKGETNERRILNGY